MSGAAPLRERAAAGMRWTLGATICTTLGQALQLVALGRLLSPQAFGLMAMVLIIVGFVQAYTDLGLSGALVYRHDATEQQLSSLYWLNVVAGIVAAVLVYLLAPLVATLFGEVRLVELLRVVSVTFVLAAAGRQFEVLLQRDLAFHLLARADVAGVVVGTVTAVGLAFAGAGVWALVGALVSQTATKAAVLVMLGWRRHRPGPRFRLADVRSFVGFGAYQVGERALNFVGERADQMLLGAMLGAGPLGHYGFAFNLVSQPVNRINPIVTRVAFPTLARVREEPDRLRRGFLEISRLLTTVNAPLLLGLAAVAPALVPLLFGDKWLPSVPLVQLLSLVALSRAVGNPIGSLMLATGRADLGFKWNVLFLVVGLPAVYFGARAAGAVGIAFALLVVQLFLQALSYPLLIRPLIGRCGPGYGAAILRPVAYASVMAIVVSAMAPMLDAVWPAYVVVAAQIAVGGLAYLGLLAAFERGILREIRGLVTVRA